MINVIICEDNIKDRKRTEEIVKKFFKDKKLDYKIHLYDDYNHNFYNILKSNLPFKIYLLDIETPSASGIDIARDIRTKDIDSPILFLTAHEELGGLVLKDDLMFLSFINKFDNFEKRLPLSLNKALKLLKRKQVIKINDKNILYTIVIDSILYITKDSFERKTIIKTDYDEIKVNKTLIEVISMLDNRFVQTHRSCYINNERKIKVDLNKKVITFDNGEIIDIISKKYRKELKS